MEKIKKIKIPANSYRPVTRQRTTARLTGFESRRIFIWFKVSGINGVVGDVNADDSPLLELLLLQLMDIILVSPVRKVVSLHYDVEIALHVSRIGENCLAVRISIPGFLVNFQRTFRSHHFYPARDLTRDQLSLMIVTETHLAVEMVNLIRVLA